jgi:hypothetical protein
VKQLEGYRKGVLKKRGKGYQMVNEAGEFHYVPGVTTVIGMLDKSRPLMKWAERMQRAADVEAAFRLYRDGGLPDGLSREEFGDQFLGWSGEARAAQKAAQEAADFGTRLHGMIEQELLRRLGQEVSEPDPEDLALEMLFADCEEWAESVNLTPLATEQCLWSTVGRYAGTADCIAEMDTPWGHKCAVIDWKTAANIYEEMHIQSVAYRAALKELTGKASVGCIVKLPRNEDSEVEVTWVDPAQDRERLEVFLTLRSIFDWWKRKENEGLEAWKARKRAEELKATQADLVPAKPPLDARAHAGDGTGAAEELKATMDRLSPSKG